METSTQADIGNQASETLQAAPEQHDWWEEGLAARNVTQVDSPPVVIYPSRDFDRSPVLPAVMVAAGGTTMLMSLLPWVTANFAHHTTRVWGLSPLITKAISSNGWITFTGGATVVFMGLLMLASGVFALRVISTLLATMTAGIAAYDTVRLVQRVHQAHHGLAHAGVLATRLAGDVHLGYGIVVVLCVSFLALVASAIQLTRY